LEERFKKGATVDAGALVESGLVSNFNNPIKVLGQGELTIKLDVTADKFSASAIEKIEAAGGSVTVIEKKKWVREYPEKPKRKPKKKEAAEATEPEVTKTEEVTEAPEPDVTETPQATEASETTDEEVVDAPEITKETPEATDAQESVDDAEEQDSKKTE
jgi:hypothetical protein